MDFDADSVGSPVSIRSGDKKDKKKKDKKSRKDDETNFMESTEFKLTMQKLETGGPEAMTMQLVEQQRGLVSSVNSIKQDMIKIEKKAKDNKAEIRRLEDEVQNL